MSAGENGGWLRGGRSPSATHAIEKTPQFRSAMARFAERAGERLGATFGALFTAALEPTRNGAAFAVLGEHSGDPAAALYSATLDARLALIFEPGAVALVIAAMFGIEAANDGASAASSKPPTALEMRLLGEAAAALAAAFADAFAPVADFELSVEILETIEDEVLLGPKDSQTLVAPFAIKAPAGSFGAVLVLPHPFLTALTGAFARGPAAGATTLDPVWSSRMESRVRQTSLTLTAILDEFPMSLADVSSLMVGHVLPLGDSGQVRIESGERGVFVCSLGERGGRYALEIEEIIARPFEASYPGATTST